MRSTTQRRGKITKPFVGIGAFDDLDRPAADLGKCGPEFRSSIAAVGEDMAQPGEGLAHGAQHQGSAVAVLNIGAVNHQSDQQAERIGHDMALAALYLLARVEAGDPAGLSVVFTLWLSITPALGLASRPSNSRAAMTR